MRINIFACALALAAPLLPAQQPAAVSTPPPTASPSQPEHDFKLITLQRSDTGTHFFVDASVDGKDTRFLVDSGATGLFFISQELASSLGKKPVHEAGSAADDAPKATFGDVFIGKSIRLKNQTLPVLKLPMLAQLTMDGKPVEAQGMVGSHFLKGIRGCFDYGKSRLIYPKVGIAKGAYRLAREKRGDLILPLREGAAGFPYITIRLMGKEFEFLIDTASALTTIEPTVAKELGLETEKSGPAASSLSRAVLPKVWLARQETGPMEFFVSASQASQTAPKGTRFGGVVGSKFLVGLRASLDFDTYSLVIPKPAVEAEKAK